MDIWEFFCYLDLRDFHRGEGRLNKVSILLDNFL